MQDFSAKGFLDFFDYLSRKGLMNKSTIAARKASSKAILAVLDDEETADLRKIDVDDAVTRFVHMKGEQFDPKSLTVYKSRFSNALADFLAYRADPLGFRPKAPRTRLRKKAPDQPKPHQSSPNTDTTVEKTSSIGHGPVGLQETLVFPIPIRPDVTVQIAGIPSDLTSSEAKKITAVITALGTNPEEEL